MAQLLTCPFPGMDPWLEEPAEWPNVHHSIITKIRDRLQALVPEPYYVKAGVRVYIEQLSDLEETERRPIVPDVAILREAPSSGGVAGAVVDAPIRVRVELLEQREGFVEIRDGSRDHALVTAIEVLSPANKRRGAGREEYLRKQTDVLASRASLVEIDLLRGGELVVAIPPELLPRSAYRVVVTPGHERTLRNLYPFGVRDRLPRVAVPLTQSAFVPLDLGAVLREEWENGPYRRLLRYDQDPTPPLAPDDLAWARERVAAARA